MPLCACGGETLKSPQRQSILSHMSQEVPRLGLTAEFQLILPCSDLTEVSKCPTYT